jgi:hypothetical protein
MAGSGPGNGFGGRAPPPGFAGSRLVGPRQESPDSDVLAFSDDEHGRGPPGAAVERVKAQSNVPTARRSSWLPEVGAKAMQRKFSIGATSIHSTGSQPPTPAADIEGTGRPSVPHLNFSSNIWGIDKRRDSIGHQEALTSPTTLNYPSGEERFSALPVQIPLNPTIKTYRSQSYSVGQQDPEQIPTPPATGGRMHSVAYPQGPVTNRPSRPSLGSVMEDEMTGGNNLEDPSNLRKQAALSASRIRSPFASQYGQNTDFAVDDSEDGVPEAGDHSEATSPASKRAQWSSSLGFGKIHEPSQSRRHSMHVPANVRGPQNDQQASMSATPEVQKQLAQRLQSLALSHEGKLNVLFGIMSGSLLCLA